MSSTDDKMPVLQGTAEAWGAADAQVAWLRADMGTKYQLKLLSRLCS